MMCFRHFITVVKNVVVAILYNTLNWVVCLREIEPYDKLCLCVVAALSYRYSGVDIATKQLDLWMYYVQVFGFNVDFERHIVVAFKYKC